MQRYRLELMLGTVFLAVFVEAPIGHAVDSNERWRACRAATVLEGLVMTSAAAAPLRSPWRA